jgi:putative transposase
MKRKRYSEEKIISVAEGSIYRWKAKYGGMEVSDAKRLRELEAENRKLKRLLGEAELDKAALKELVEGKW